MSVTTDTTLQRYLTYQTAAAYIGISVATLRRMVDAGKVRTYPLGERLVRFDRLELDQYVRGSVSSSTEHGG